MMARFCAYVGKVFKLGLYLGVVRDTRRRPRIPTAGVFSCVFAMFATGRKALNALEPDLRMPARLRSLVGPSVPSVDTIGRVYASRTPRAVPFLVPHQPENGLSKMPLEGCSTRGGP